MKTIIRNRILPVLIGVLILGLAIYMGCRIDLNSGITPEETTTPAAELSQNRNLIPIIQAAVMVHPAKEHIVIIDPGHQQHADTTMEPDAPGSLTTKYRDSGGTYSRTTMKYEYELNLEVGLKLRDELEARGYKVYMTRESNDTNIGNIERAQFAADHDGDIMVRIHANGSENPEANGAMTICQTANNPYQNLYTQSRLLADCVLDCYVAATGIKKEYVWETDTMTGCNWCTVPNIIIEMGYMTNPEEDALMASPDFQTKIVFGIADGVDLYFEQS